MKAGTYNISLRRVPKQNEISPTFSIKFDKKRKIMESTITA